MKFSKSKSFTIDKVTKSSRNMTFSVRERTVKESSTAELRFNHCTAVTRSLGDPINNVDYTIKHTELREEVKAQRDKDTLLFTRDSLLESFLFV